MLNPHHQRPLPSGARPNDGSLVCYGIVVATASLLLLVILAATVSIVKACALAGAVAVVFIAAGCVSRRCAADGTAPARPMTVAMPAARARAACGLVDAAIDALPAFAYARHAGTCGAEGSSSKSGRCALCSVCLEDVEAGEMVRQLPACGHLFHVGCIDMWLHSHATCPLCRCDVSPQPVAVKLTAAADPRDGALPPV
ncbi:unnamed protein product [Miscanthus lutarioriparius]|uniref:RING-type E3 ubiquitin transferase n=1 Tax=Miscanthus lutarioriparius TaxID=422564 RepID=A0A811PV24_9POAL|nr:unnamed protein product [Miscanthus lutarioriparius]